MSSLTAVRSISSSPPRIAVVAPVAGGTGLEQHLRRRCRTARGYAAGSVTRKRCPAPWARTQPRCLRAGRAAGRRMPAGAAQPGRGQQRQRDAARGCTGFRSMILDAHLAGPLDPMIATACDSVRARARENHIVAGGPRAACRVPNACIAFLLRVHSMMNVHNNARSSWPCTGTPSREHRSPFGVMPADSI